MDIIEILDCVNTIILKRWFSQNGNVIYSVFFTKSKALLKLSVNIFSKITSFFTADLIMKIHENGTVIQHNPDLWALKCFSFSYHFRVNNKSITVLQCYFYYFRCERWGTDNYFSLKWSWMERQRIFHSMRNIRNIKKNNSLQTVDKLFLQKPTKSPYITQNPGFDKLQSSTMPKCVFIFIFTQ